MNGWDQKLEQKANENEVELAKIEVLNRLYNTYNSDNNPKVKEHMQIVRNKIKESVNNLK